MNQNEAKKLLSKLLIGMTPTPKIYFEIDMDTYMIDLKTEGVDADHYLVSYLEYLLFEVLKAKGVNKESYLNGFDEKINMAYEDEKRYLIFNGINYQKVWLKKNDKSGGDK